MLAERREFWIPSAWNLDDDLNILILLDLCAKLKGQLASGGPSRYSPSYMEF
jgi:hypothetical protein